MSRPYFPVEAVFCAVNYALDGSSLGSKYWECYSGNLPGLVAVSRRFGVVMLMLSDGGGFPLGRDDRDERNILAFSPQPCPTTLLGIFLCFLHSGLSSDTKFHVS